MRRSGMVVFPLLSVLLAILPGGEALAKSKPRMGKLLYMTLSAGYKHSSIEPSEAIVKEIGERSGLFETTVTQDVGAFTRENLKKYDVVMFYTSGELPMTAAEKSAFLHFVRSGHGFVGVHSATDTFFLWKDYLDMIGGYFNDHPWHQQVRVDVTAPDDPIVKFLGQSFQADDEIYQFSDFQSATTHVLLTLDTRSVNLHNPRVRPRYYGFPLAWTRRYGKGRVFYTAFGHEEAVWKSQWYQQLLLNGIKYAMGRMQ